MRPYYSDLDREGTCRAAAIVGFERVMRSGWPSPCGRRPGGFVHTALTLLRCWLERGGQRQQLARLDLRALRDMGISLEMAGWECNKPFWRR
jgi:uncharacterized protein YjiS (DUF1127 family)